VSALDAIRQWLSPILDPFNELPAHLAAMQQNHRDSLDTFHGLMSALAVAAPAGQAFSGSAAGAATTSVEQFYTEFSVDGAIAEITTATSTAVAEMESASATLVAVAADDAVLLEVTAAVDVASVAQAGLDPVTDVPAVILTVIAGAAILGALVTFGWAIYEAVQAWNGAMSRASSKPYPSPPRIGTVPPPQGSLTPKQEGIARRLHADYGHLGLSLDDIRAIIAANPHLSEAQLRRLLDQFGALVARHPELIGAGGAVAAFQRFIAGDISAAQQLPDLTGKTRAEAEAELQAEGFVRGRTTPGGYERWDGPDGSQIWIRPDGEIVRVGPSVPRSDGQGFYRPRYGPDGKRLPFGVPDNHNTGERIVP
jgi:hypothetical protein